MSANPLTEITGEQCLVCHQEIKAGEKVIVALGMLDTYVLGSAGNDAEAGEGVVDTSGYEHGLYADMDWTVQVIFHVACWVKWTASDMVS